LIKGLLDATAYEAFDTAATGVSSLVVRRCRHVEVVNGSWWGISYCWWIVDVGVVMYVFRLCIGYLCCCMCGMRLSLCLWDVVFWFCWCVLGFDSVVVGASVRVVSWGLRVLFLDGEVLWNEFICGYPRVG
jgi:hypothetical protein